MPFILACQNIDWDTAFVLKPKGRKIYTLEASLMHGYSFHQYCALCVQCLSPWHTVDLKIQYFSLRISASWGSHRNRERKEKVGVLNKWQWYDFVLVKIKVVCGDTLWEKFLCNASQNGLFWVRWFVRLQAHTEGLAREFCIAGALAHAWSNHRARCKSSRTEVVYKDFSYIVKVSFCKCSNGWDSDIDKPD